MKTRVRCRFPSPRMRATARLALSYGMERGTPPKNATAASWPSQNASVVLRRIGRSRSRRRCGEGRRQGSGSLAPSPRRCPPGRGPQGDAGAPTSRATEAAAPVEDPLRRVPLLVVAGPIVLQNPIDDGSVRRFVLGPFCQTLTNLSPKMTANCVLASNHSRGGRFHASAA